MLVGGRFAITMPPKCGTSYLVRHLRDTGKARLEGGRHNPRWLVDRERLSGRDLYALVRDLVLERDRVLIERFGFEPPTARAR